jgi:hypothetical protein
LTGISSRVFYGAVEHTGACRSLNHLRISIRDLR